MLQSGTVFSIRLWNAAADAPLLVHCVLGHKPALNGIAGDEDRPTCSLFTFTCDEYWITALLCGSISLVQAGQQPDSDAHGRTQLNAAGTLACRCTWRDHKLHV